MSIIVSVALGSFQSELLKGYVDLTHKRDRDCNNRLLLARQVAVLEEAFQAPVTFNLAFGHLPKWREPHSIT